MPSTAPQGRVRRYWRVTDNSGLGHPSERSLYLALLLLTAEAWWDSRKVIFSIRALALRLNMEPDPNAYEWITDALDRLAFLHVHFLGTTEHPQEGTRCITVGFFLVLSIERTAEDDDTDYTIHWNGEVFRALRSATTTDHNNEPILPMEQLLSGLLTPKDPELTRPVQAR